MPEKNIATSFDSKYRKILIAAKRSKQIQNGARPRVSLPNAKPTRIAFLGVWPARSFND